MGKIMHCIDLFACKSFALLQGDFFKLPPNYYWIDKSDLEMYFFKLLYGRVQNFLMGSWKVSTQNNSFFAAIFFTEE